MIRLRIRQPDFVLLNEFLRRLSSELEGWNAKAAQAGASVAPFADEASRLAGMVAWGKEQIAKSTDIDDITDSVSVPTLRYYKAALHLARHRLEEKVSERAAAGWPAEVTGSIKEQQKRIEYLERHFPHPPGYVFWVLIGRAHHYQQYFRDPVVGEGILRRGYSGLACGNIRLALSSLTELGAALPPSDVFDEEMERRVLAFQEHYDHKFVDGVVGPGTRARLTKVVLEEVGAKFFERLEMASGIGVASREQSSGLRLRQGPMAHLEAGPQVFLSYAWEDSAVVNKVDQWLRDNGVRVRRDTRDFIPGKQLPEMIEAAVRDANKVIAVYSERSKARDWPAFEIKVAEEAERDGIYKLIYLLLDETPLPKHDPNRVAVMAKRRRLKDVGGELLRGIHGVSAESTRYEYDPEEVLP